MAGNWDLSIEQTTSELGEYALVGAADYAFSKVCPTAVSEPKDHKLEAVSIYQTIDLLCEGEIDGLCDQNGKLIRLTSDSNKNEDGFKGIYLNDVAVKNTNVNTLNYNRVFADFRIGGAKQRLWPNLLILLCLSRTQFKH